MQVPLSYLYYIFEGKFLNDPKLVPKYVKVYELLFVLYRSINTGSSYAEVHTNCLSYSVNPFGFTFVGNLTALVFDKYAPLPIHPPAPGNPFKHYFCPVP